MVKRVWRGIKIFSIGNDFEMNEDELRVKKTIQLQLNNKPSEDSCLNLFGNQDK
jgi:hypothetical protein